MGDTEDYGLPCYEALATNAQRGSPKASKSMGNALNQRCVSTYLWIMYLSTMGVMVYARR